MQNTFDLRNFEAANSCFNFSSQRFLYVLLDFFFFFFWRKFVFYHDIVHISKQGTRCLLYILFIRWKFLYAAAVISLQFIVTMFIIILCICIYVYIYIHCWKVPVFILLNIVHIEIQHPVRLRWCYGCEREPRKHNKQDFNKA